jgi:hypothetical protein
VHGEAEEDLVAGDENAAGGDWFDAVPLDDGRVAVMVGDVVGHGPGAAGVVGQLRAVMTQLLLDGWSVADVLARLDRFAARPPAAAGSTVCLAVVDAEVGTVEHACCGHPPPLVVPPDGPPRFLDLPGGGPLAVTTCPPGVATAGLGPDDVVLLYTDGLIERRHRPLEEGVEQLRGLAAEAAGDAVERLCARVLEGMTGRGYEDDVCVLVFRTTAPAPPLRVELPAVAGSERVVRRRLHQWMTAAGVAEADAVAHAYAAGPGPVRVEAEHRPEGQVAVTVSDRGRWRTPEPGRRPPRRPADRARPVDAAGAPAADRLARRDRRPRPARGRPARLPRRRPPAHPGPAAGDRHRQRRRPAALRARRAEPRRGAAGAARGTALAGRARPRAGRPAAPRPPHRLTRSASPGRPEGRAQGATRSTAGTGAGAPARTQT